MHAHQEVMMRLVSELIETCKEHQIPCTCVDRLAWQAYKFHEFRDGTFDAFLAVPSKHRAELAAALDKRKERELDFYKDKKTGVTTLRYLDSNTFYLDMTEKRKLSIPAIGIDVKLVDAHEESFLYPHDGKAVPMKPEDLFPTEDFLFEGMMLPIPKNYDSYFTLTQGENWRKTKYKGVTRRDKLELVFDAKLPYRQALSFAPLRRASKAFRFKHREHFSLLQRKIGPVKKRTDLAYKQRRIIVRRFKCWEELYPRKAEILSLSARGENDELKTILAGYVDDTRYYMQGWNTPMWVSQWLYDAAKPIFQEQYGDAFVEKFEKRLDEKNKVDVEDVLREAGMRLPAIGFE